MLALAVALLVACGGGGTPIGNGGNNLSNKLLPTFVSLEIDPNDNPFNGDKESDICLEVKQKAETFDVIVNLSNPDGYEILSLNLNDRTIESKDFFKDSTNERIILKSLATTETSGEIEIKVDRIMYSLKNTPTRVAGIKDNVKTLRLQPDFTLTLNYGEESYGEETSTISTVKHAYQETLELPESVLMNAYAPLTEDGDAYGKEGYIFVGWFTEKGGQGTEIAEYSRYYFYKDVTLYAHYDRAFEYRETEDAIIVTGITKAGQISSFNIEIPEIINGKPVKEIADKAFATAASGKVIILPDTVVRIGDYAFQGATNLQIHLGLVEEIGKQAFDGCGKLVLGKEGRYIKTRFGGLPSSLSKIGDYAFRGCSWDTNIKNPLREGYLQGEDTLFIPATLKYIGNSAFASSLFKTVYFESGNQFTAIKLYEEGSVNENGNLGEKVFESSHSLTSLYTGVIFQQTGAGQLNFNATSAIKEIPYHAFYDCSALKSNISNRAVRLNEGLEVIGDLAFASNSDGMKDLKYLQMPDSLKEIGKESFANNGLEEVVFNESSRLETLGDWCFENTKLTEITLYSVSAFGEGPFWGSTSLKKVNILANNVPTYSYETYWGAGVTRGFKYYVKSSLLSSYRSNADWIENGESEYVCAYENIITDVNGTTLCYEPIDENGNLDFSSTNVRISAVLSTTSEIIIPSSFSHNNVAYTVTAVSKYFVHQKVTKVTLPSTLKRIESMAFYACNVLYEVVWKEGNKVLNDGDNKDIALEYIGESAFSNTAITEFYSNTALKEIDKQAFSNCKNLAHVVIERGTALKIKGSAFSGSGLRTLVIGANVDRIYNSAFQNNQNLSLVLINRPDSGGDVESLVPQSSDGEYPPKGTNPFAYCNGINNIFLFSNNALDAFTRATIKGQINGYAEVKKKDGVTSAYSVYSGSWQDALAHYNIY